MRSQAGTARILEARRGADNAPLVVSIVVDGSPIDIEVSRWSDYAKGDQIFWSRDDSGGLKIDSRLSTQSAAGLISLLADSLGQTKPEVRRMLGVKSVSTADAHEVFRRAESLLEKDEYEHLKACRRDELAFTFALAAWAKSGVPERFCKKLLSTVGEGVIPLVVSDSLSCAKSDKFAFPDAAEISLIRKDASEGGLVRMAIEKTLAENESGGSIYMPSQLLVKEVGKKLLAAGVKTRGAAVHLAMMLGSGEVVARQIRDGVYIARAELASAERRVAQNLARLAAAAPSDDFPAALRSVSVELTDPAQRGAVAGAGGGVTIITGGPGTGKTTISSLIAKAADKAGLRVMYLAPTGAAAERSDAATGRGAQTIHSALYTKESERLAAADIILVDEPSMLGVRTADALLRKIPSGKRVILVGDAGQLESVEAGNLLDDVIESGAFPVFTLDRVFRTDESSLICTNASAIRAGDARSIRFGAGFENLDADSPEAIAQALLDEVRRRQAVGTMAGTKFLTPINKGPAGVWELNKAIKQLVNPGDGKKPVKGGFGAVFHDGDAVVRTKNDRKIGLANGTEGTLRVVGDEVFLQSGEKTIKLNRKLLADFSLAYATSIHKSQGSEYRDVVMAMPKSASKMLNRKLVMTAITRAKRGVVVVGKKETLLAAAITPGVARFTALKDLLVDAAARLDQKRVKAAGLARIKP